MTAPDPPAPPGPWRAFLVWWRPRRVRLRGLPRSTAIVLAACLLSSAWSIVVLVMQGQGEFQLIQPWDKTVFESVPPPLMVALLVGFAACVAAVAATCLTASRPVRLATLAGCVLPAVILLAGPFGSSVAALYTSVPAPAATLLAIARPVMVAAVSIAVASSAVAVVRPPNQVPAAALITSQALPYLAFLALWGASLAVGGELGGVQDARFPDPLPVNRLFELPAVWAGLCVAGVALVLTLWLAYTGGRAAAVLAQTVVAIGRRYAASSVIPGPGPGGADRRWWLVVALCAVKVLGYGLGLAGLRLELDGLDTLSRDPLEDGWVSWLVAVAIAAVAVRWLATGARGPRDESALLGAGVTIAALLAFPEILYQALAGGYLATGADWLFTAALWVEGHQPWGYVLAPVVAGVAAVLLARGPRRAAARLLLGMFAVWVGLRVPVLVAELTGYPWYPWLIDMPSEAGYGQRVGWVDLTTIDLVLSAALGVVAVLAARGRAPGFPLGPTALVAVASTLLANSALVLPDLFLVGAGVYLRFWIPAVYQLVFDAESLNEPAGARSRRLLSFAAINTLALSVGVLRGSHGGPGADNDLQMAADLVVPPVLAASIVMAAGRWRAHSSTLTTSGSALRWTGSASGSTSSVLSTASTTEAADSPR